MVQSKLKFCDSSGQARHSLRMDKVDKETKGLLFPLAVAPPTYEIKIWTPVQNKKHKFSLTYFFTTKVFFEGGKKKKREWERKRNDTISHLFLVSALSHYNCLSEGEQHTRPSHTFWLPVLLTDALLFEVLCTSLCAVNKVALWAELHCPQICGAG